MDSSPGVVALLFTDLVGSTELLGRLGDDAGEELRRAHFSLLREAVAKSSGQEVKSLGDGLMVAFASPVDAVGCAVAMQRAVQGYNERSGGHALAIRIGLHAGDPHREAGDFHGTAVVVASRLCDVASGGQILASELLADLVGSRGGFSFRPLAQLTLKGLARPVATVSVDWDEALSERPVPVAPAPNRTPSRPPRPRGPELVGRDAVLVELEAELDRTRGGELRCVLLLGEPGVGKTRLAGELVAGPAEDLTALTARAYPLGATASLGLWVEALECHLRQLEPPEIRDLCGPYLDDLAALFGSLSPLRGDRSGPEPSRVRILEGLVALLERVAGSGPLVVVLDDVHLADGSSWEALAFLARSLSTSPILIVLAARPVELSEQPVATQVLLALDQEGLLRRLPLSPLAPEDVRRLAGTALGGRPVSEALLSWLMDRTRGNPLFVLGLVRALVEEGADLEAPTLRYLPENLAERVTSRLASLGEAEVGLLELLAVLGRPVEFDDLIILSGQDGGRLGDLLPALVRSRLVAEEERGGELTYGIAHPLVQEALYQATGGARRRALHRSVGRTLQAAERLGEAASHFSRAARPGDPEAVSALLDAVRQAEERQAYRESLALLRSLVQLLPSGDERWLAVVDAIRWESNWVIDQPAELEVALGIAALREMDAVLEGRQDPSRAATVKFRLAASIAWGEGSHDEAKHLYRRAQELFEAAGNPHGARLSSNEVAFVSGMHGDFEAMEAGATAALAVAEEAGDIAVVRRALSTTGWSAFFRGRFALAEESFRRNLATDFLQPEEPFRLTLTLSSLAVSVAFEGRLREARTLIEEAKRLDPAHATPLSEWETRIRWLEGDFSSAVAGARDLLSDTSRVLSPRTTMGLPFAAISAAEVGNLEEAERYLAVAEMVPGGRFFILESYCGFAEAVLAGRRGDTADCISRLGMVADTLLDMGALPFAAFVLSEQAEEAGRSGDAPTAARAARHLEEIAEQIDRPLYRAMSASGTAWSLLGAGAASPTAGARQAVSILADLGYRPLCGRAFEVLGHTLRSVDPPAAKAAFEQAVDAFDSCGAVWRRDRLQAGMRGSA